MGARKKLNEANTILAILLGGLAGLITQSWFVFAAVTGLVLATAVNNRAIR